MSTDMSFLLRVPFIQQPSELNCGPTCLAMALEYLQSLRCCARDGKDGNALGSTAAMKSAALLERVQTIENILNLDHKKGVSSIRLALAAKHQGFEASFYTTSLIFNEEHQHSQYYQRYGDLNLDTSKTLVREALDMGVKLEERSVELDEVLRQSQEKSAVIIALIDISILVTLLGSQSSDSGSSVDNYDCGDEAEEPNLSAGNEYCGHFVVIVGYDAAAREVLVHNPERLTPQAYLRVDRDVFDAARKAAGTDQDLIVISNKATS